MAWMMTHEIDWDANDWDETPVKLANLRFGPSSISQKEIDSLKAGKGHAWRCYDDDGVHQASGRMLAIDFGPLDDYCMPNSGATEIRYWENGWKTL